MGVTIDMSDADVYRMALCFMFLMQKELKNNAGVVEFPIKELTELENSGLDLEYRAVEEGYQWRIARNKEIDLNS